MAGGRKEKGLLETCINHHARGEDKHDLDSGVHISSQMEGSAI